jgi:F-type H+-transporting ATPase subunit epsilon
VLADTAESAEEIDLERAKRAREDAAQRLKVSKHDDPEFEVQSMRIKRAAARIRVAGQK